MVCTQTYISHYLNHVRKDRSAPSGFYKQVIVHANDEATMVTGRTLGAPVRNIKNGMTERLFYLEKSDATRDELEELTLGSLQKAVDGDTVEGSVMAGQISGMIREIKTCQEVINEMVEDAQAVIQKLQKTHSEFAPVMITILSFIMNLTP